MRVFAHLLVVLCFSFIAQLSASLNVTSHVNNASNITNSSISPIAVNSSRPLQLAWSAKDTVPVPVQFSDNPNAKDWCKGYLICGPLCLEMSYVSDKAKCIMQDCGPDEVRIGRWIEPAACIASSRLVSGRLPTSWKHKGCTGDRQIACAELGNASICVDSKRIKHFERGKCTLEDCGDHPDAHPCKQHGRTVCMPYKELEAIDSEDKCVLKQSNMSNSEISGRCGVDTVLCRQKGQKEHTCVHFSRLTDYGGKGIDDPHRCYFRQCPGDDQIFCNSICYKISEVKSVDVNGKCELHNPPTNDYIVVLIYGLVIILAVLLVIAATTVFYRLLSKPADREAAENTTISVSAADSDKAPFLPTTRPEANNQAPEV